MKILAWVCMGLFFIPGHAENIAHPVLACAACHGMQGISQTSLVPNLAGQHPTYLLKQLTDMQQNRRAIPSMDDLIASLPPKDLDALALYYGKMARTEGSTAHKHASSGESLYRSACSACHGPKGDGNLQAGFPVLSGQRADYTAAQLQAFKQGLRSNDMSQVMQTICSRLSEEDIKALADYIEGLH